MPARRKLTRQIRSELIGAIKAGASKEQAAAIAGVSRQAIYKACERSPAFKDEIEEAKASCDGTAVRSLFRLVLQGNVAACIWWTKARMGWRERMTVDSTPAPPASEGLDLSRLTDEQLERLEEIVKTAST